MQPKIGLCGHSVFVQAIRGCCVKCYNILARKVKAGELTWANLEAEGKVLPAKPRNWKFDFHAKPRAKG